MGRNRKTVEQLERSGALKRNPGRYADAAASPIATDPLGPPPQAFAASPELLACWDDVLEATAEVKLCSMDRLHVEMTARLMFRCRQPRANAAWYAELKRHLGKFGLTQVDRSKVSGIDQETAATDMDEWAELAAGGCPKWRKN